MNIFNSKKKKEEQKKEYIKNFAILIGICLLTILVALFIRNWYRSYNEVANSEKLINISTKELNDVELYSYLLENPNAFVYISNFSEETKKIDKDMYKFLKNNSLVDSIIYLDVSNKTDLNTFYEEFNNNYQQGIFLSTIPAFAFFEDGKLNKLYVNDDLTIANINNMIIESTKEVLK